MFLAFLLAAVPPADVQAMRDLVTQDIRVASVGDRLARSGYCDGHLSHPGWVLQDIQQYNPKLRDSAMEALELGDAPTIVAVLPQSAAAASGLRPGDEVVAVSGRWVADDAVKKPSYARVAGIEQAIEQGLGLGQVVVRVRRGDAAWDVTFKPEKGCSSRFQLLTGVGLNAKADGRYVQVSGGLIEFVRNDDELALVIAHELAHNILGHRERLDAAGVSRGLLAGFGKNRTRIREAELEADRLALYLMARAGYDPGVAPAFWQRFGRKLLPGFLSDGTHPGTAERVRRAEAEIARIRTQQAAGQQPTP